MGHGQMLRVSKVDEWLHHAPTRPDLSTRGDCVIIRSGQGCDGKQGASLAPGVSNRPPGAQALRLHLVMIPARSRGVPHYHDGHESAIYAVSGETEVWHGKGLVERTAVRAGDFMYIPPGTPHLAVNRADVTAIAVIARADPSETERVVVVELPRHLAELLSFPIAVQELPRTPAPASRGDAVNPARRRWFLLRRRHPRGLSPPIPPDSLQCGRGSRWCSSGNRGHPGATAIRRLRGAGRRRPGGGRRRPGRCGEPGASISRGDEQASPGRGHPGSRPWRAGTGASTPR